MPTMVMTPHVGTPAIFQQQMPPWVTQTPESSPMLYSCGPVNEGCYGYGMQAPAMQPGMSREQLRAICQPYFEQMLVSVHQAVQCQQGGGQQFQGQCHNMQGFPTLMQHGFPSEEPSTADGSDISSEAAFSTILSPPPNAVAEERLKRGHQVEVAAESQYGASEIGEDQEKAVMVCRHWKTKGWCRMEGNCKFLHPAHKCGVGSAMVNKVPEGTRTSNEEIRDDLDDSEQFPALGEDGKKKSAKKRKSKGIKNLPA